MPQAGFQAPPAPAQPALSPGNQALAATVVGGAKIVQGVSKPLMQASNFLQNNSQRPVVSQPTVGAGKSILGRVWDTLKADPKTLETQALNNSRAHSQSLLPVAKPIGKAARNLTNDTQATIDAIEPRLSVPARITAEGIGMLPDLAFSGANAGLKAINFAQQTAKNVADGVSIPGAIAQAIIPGNGKLANVVQNAATALFTPKTFSPRSTSPFPNGQP
jgi:hypothetical protein